ncbi:MAG TPA: kynureninase [Nocardioidaceae bacterium]
MSSGTETTRAYAEQLDRADPLASYRDEFVIPDDDLVYLDGNSLGRLPKSSQERVKHVLDDDWGGQLIRSWEDRWMHLPTQIGDLIGTGLLGAAPGEVVVGDSTTVSLYKAMSALLDAQSDRRAVIIERDNFPSDRYLVESLAKQRDLEVRWIDETGYEGVSSDHVKPLLDNDVALVSLSHVDYRSAAIVDMASITAAVHEVGALTLWDLCHSVGSIPIDLHRAGADVAVGCTYKYLNSGPGAPAFTYVRTDLQPRLSQPIWGWWSRAEMFDMAQGYQPYADMRSWLVGTPSVLSLVAIEPSVRLILDAGMDALRAKSLLLTAYAVDLFDSWLAPLGAGLASPREPERRGSHVTVTVPDAKVLCAQLTRRGVLPDFRRPDGIRIGLAPLTTRFVDVYDGLATLRGLLVSGVTRSSVDVAQREP